MSQVKPEHIVHFVDAPWQDLVDEHGQILAGIRGKTGSVAIGSDGQTIGCDLIEMQPGSAFPAHIHAGDHILYAISGEGNVTVGKETYFFGAGSTFSIKASIPHNVGTYGGDQEPFVLLAFGHPHKHVSAQDRMTVVEIDSPQPWTSIFPGEG